MKKVRQLIKEIIKGLGNTFYPPAFGTKKKLQAAELQKAWYTYMKDKDNKTPASDKQRKLLYQFMDLHSKNDLN